MASYYSTLSSLPSTSRSTSRPSTGCSVAWNSTVYQRCNSAPPAGGLLGRFENMRERPSRKKIVTCDAATPEYLRHDFLKVANGRPRTSANINVSHSYNYHPSSDLQETKFHRGFQRRAKADIQSDAARLDRELAQQWAREERDRAAIQIAKEMKNRCTFNILTGEGVGRECEYQPVGKRIVNPFGCMEAVFAEHARDTSNRTRQSGHRFFEVPAGSPGDPRSLRLYNDGLSNAQRQVAIIGSPASRLPARLRGASVGVADNFAHSQGPL